MAQEVKVEDQKQVEVKEKKAKFSYFRNPKYAKEALVYGQEKQDSGKTVFKRERFQGFVERIRGDLTRVGYLKTDVPQVIEACKAKNYVEEISEKEFTSATEGKKVERF